MRRARRSTNTRTTARSGAGAPPIPIVVKASKLDGSGLANAYEWMAVDLGLGLRMATEWYAANVTTLLRSHPLDADSMKTYDRAQKAKAQGDSATIDGEKQQSWRTALRLYGKIWPIPELPKVDTVEAQIGTGVISRRVESIKSVLESLNTAFAGRIHYQPSASLAREATGDTIYVPQEELESFCAVPPLKLALTEAPIVAQVLSTRTVEGKDEDGKDFKRDELDGAAFFATLPVILAGVYEWAATKINLTKAPGRVAAPKAARVPRVPGTPRAPKAPGASGPKSTILAVDPFGVFRANTIRAAVAAQLGDNAWHRTKDLEAYCNSQGYMSTSTIGNVIRDLIAKGVKVETQGRAHRMEVRVAP